MTGHRNLEAFHRNLVLAKFAEMRPKNLAPFAEKFPKIGHFLSFTESNQLAVGAATSIEKRRAGGNIMGALF